MNISTTVQTIVVMFLWSMCFPLLTVGIQYSPHLTFAALRAAIAGIALLSLAMILKRPLPTEARVWLLLLSIGAGATSLGYLGMFHAAEFVSPGIASVIANAQPILAAILASVFLGERLSLLGKVGLFFGFCGIVLTASPELLSTQGTSYAIGLMYIILAAFGITISNVAIKYVAGKVDALVAMGLQLLFGSILLALAAIATEEPLSIKWTATFIATLLALGILGSAVPYWLWFNVLNRVPLAKANAFSFLVPIFGLSIAGLFFDETINSMHIIGISLSLFGIALVTRSTTTESPRSK